MKPQSLPLPQSLENLFEYESFLTILRYYVDLNCFVITPDPGDGSHGWMAVHYNRRSNSLYDFQKKYGFRFDWSRLTDPGFERSHAPGSPLLLESLGFYDVFTPIRRNGERLGTAFSGAFAAKELDYDQLCESWKKLTAQKASAENDEFRQFARVLLQTPVLEGPVLSAYWEALGLFASTMAGEGSLSHSRRLKQLTTEVFSKQFQHSYWMDWALGLPTSQATPLWNLEIERTDWIQSDIGVRRIPTTVITAVPRHSDSRKRNPVEEMVRIQRFQRRSFRFAQTLPQTVGGKLENYGAVYVTSADPSLSRPQRRRQVRDIAERIRRFSLQELNGPVLVGIGETVPPGDSLNESYRQAVLALHTHRDSGEKLVSLASGPGERAEGVVELTRRFHRLRSRFESASFDDLEEALDNFIQQALTLSFEVPEEIRWHLHYALVQMGEAVEGRVGFSKKESQALNEGLMLDLEKAATTQEMVIAFKNSLGRLADLMRHPTRSTAVYSMERIQSHLQEHFHQPLNIAQLSKLAGVSPSTLSRQFKRAQGMGLEAYLQKLRLAEAKRLLTSGSLPVAQVARSCGFKSQAYFSRLFRKQVRLAPGEFRKRSQAV